MKDNRILLVFFLLFALLLSIFTVFTSAEVNFVRGVKSFALYEPTSGRVLLSKNESEKLPMASTTKIMTGLLASEKCDIDKVVVIPQEAVGIEGSSIYLKENDNVTVRDLIYSLLLQSANDAAAALALYISGDLQSFAELMNLKAMELGLDSTSFANPHGLDAEEHYTTAKDLAILTTEALKNPLFKQIVSTYKYTFYINEEERTVVNHNKLLKRYDGCIGVKTGYTKKSGRCLVSAAERDGILLICASLGDSDDWNNHTKLFDLGFSMLYSINPTDYFYDDLKVSVIGSEKLSVKAGLEDYSRIIIDKNKSKIKAEIDLPRYVTAPIKKGQALGKLLIYNCDTLIKTIDIISEEAVDALKVKKRFLLF